jgi:hypothetical protein
LKRFTAPKAAFPIYSLHHEEKFASIGSENRHDQRLAGNKEHAPWSQMQTSSVGLTIEIPAQSKLTTPRHAAMLRVSKSD